MNVTLFRNGKLRPKLRLGRWVWLCDNGEPNHEREFWIHPYTYTSCTVHSLPIYPVVVFTPWHPGSMNRDNPLGQKSWSLTIAVEFLKWEVGCLFGMTTNEETPQSIAYFAKHRGGAA